MKITICGSQALCCIRIYINTETSSWIGACCVKCCVRLHNTNSPPCRLDFRLRWLLCAVVSRARAWFSCAHVLRLIKCTWTHTDIKRNQTEGHIDMQAWTHTCMYSHTHQRGPVTSEIRNKTTVRSVSKSPYITKAGCEEGEEGGGKRRRVEEIDVVKQKQKGRSDRWQGGLSNYWYHRSVKYFVNTLSYSYLFAFTGWQNLNSVFQSMHI